MMNNLATILMDEIESVNDKIDNSVDNSEKLELIGYKKALLKIKTLMFWGGDND